MREYEGGKDLNVHTLAQFIPVYAQYSSVHVVNLGIQRKDGAIFPYWNTYTTLAESVGLKMLAWNVWNRNEPRTVAQQTAFIPIAHEWLFVYGTDYKDIKRTVPTKTSGKKITGAIRERDGSMSYRTYHTQQQKKINSVTTTGVESSGIHPAMYPVSLPEEYIKAMAEDSVIDPFLGSGSTLIAAEKTGRICYGMELDPRYIDVIIKRWEEYTGTKAVKAGE